MAKGRKLKFKVKSQPYCFRIYFWEIDPIKEFLKQNPCDTLVVDFQKENLYRRIYKRTDQKQGK